MASKKKILIVEDEFMSVVSLRLVLIRMGYDICAEIASGEDVFFCVEQKKPDLVIMDINLTGKMDGIKTAEQIRSKYDTPILFWTGYTDRKLLGKVEKIENSVCVTKPVTPDKIGQAVKRIMTI